MALRRLLVVLAFALVGTPLFAAPAKKPATPVAPAKDPAPGSGSGDAGAGSAVEPIEEPPSATEMNGTDDNPDAPHALTTEEAKKPVVAAAPVKKVYPVELAQRPITLTQNLTEVSIAPHLQVKPFAMSDAVHARYGITDQIQIGVTYLYMGAYASELVFPGTTGNSFHSGKAFGFDVTYSIFDWLAVQVGVPFYVSPFALGLQIAAPMKFHLSDKFALGGLDDLLSISLHNFAPSFYQEVDNASAAQNLTTTTPNSHGHLRFSVYGIYQYTPNFAIMGRLGLDDDLGTSNGSNVPGGTLNGGTTVYLKAGFLYTPVHYLDVGLQLGFDSLNDGGSFGPQAFLALRI